MIMLIEGIPGEGMSLSPSALWQLGLAPVADPHPLSCRPPFPFTPVHLAWTPAGGVPLGTREWGGFMPPNGVAGLGPGRFRP